MTTSTPTWTLERCLRWTQGYLAARPDAGNPRLDAEVLLAWTLATDRVGLYTRYDQPLDPEERARYRLAVRRRAAGEPVAYITGTREFFGRGFQVDARVLVPRPETEHLVEAALARLAAHPAAAAHVVDVGCGSGAVAITLACESPRAQVTACDISAPALAVARANAAALAPGALADQRLRFVASDLLAGISGPATMVVSNPPYVAHAALDALPVDVRAFEPALALDGGDDGLDAYRRLLPQAAGLLAPGGTLLVEMGAGQAAAVAALAAADIWRLEETAKDLQGHQRVAVWTRR